MKAMRGSLLRKIKSISAITALKQGLVFQVNSVNQYFETQTIHKEQEKLTKNGLHEKVLDTSSLSALINEVEDEDENEEMYFEAEDHTTPHELSRASSPLNASYEIPLPLDSRVDKASIVGEIVNLEKETHHLALLDFEKKCPPGGSESVVLYTTSMRGIRKTFEDCNKIRFLLESSRILFSERDVCMDMGLREELWKVVGERVVPPRLFIRGRDIGGTDEVVTLHEQGKLKELLDGIPINSTMGKCSGCGGVGFVLCLKCNGSRKVKKNNNGEDEEEEEGSEVILSASCVECNENGLVKCYACF